MPQFVLRDVPPDLWSHFRTRAQSEGWALRSLILQLMEDYASGQVTPSAAAPENLAAYAWLRPYYRQVAWLPHFQQADSQERFRILWNAIAVDKRIATLEGILATEQERLLDWLQDTTQHDMADPNQLSMRPIASLRKGADYRGPGGGDVFQYEVIGLPPGHQAWIAKMNHRWQVLRSSNGVQGHWTGDYGTAQEALRDLTPRADYAQRFGDQDCVIRVWRVNDRFFARPFTIRADSQLECVTNEHGVLVEFCEMADAAAFGKAVLHLTKLFGPSANEPGRK